MRICLGQYEDVEDPLIIEQNTYSINLLDKNCLAVDLVERLGPEFTTSCSTTSSSFIVNPSEFLTSAPSELSELSIFMICCRSDSASASSSIFGSCTICVGVPDELIDFAPLSGLDNEEVSDDSFLESSVPFVERDILAPSLPRSTNQLKVV